VLAPSGPPVASTEMRAGALGDMHPSLQALVGARATGFDDAVCDAVCDPTTVWQGGVTVVRSPAVRAERDLCVAALPYASRVLGLARGIAGVYREPRRDDQGPTVDVGFSCTVCGSREFALGPVPPEWDEIFANLDPDPGELETLHRREHLACVRCRANLRVVALTKALLAAEHWPAERRPEVFNLVSLLATRPWLRVLEVNESYVVGGLLRRLPRHVAADYPDVSVEDLPYPDGSFRLVIHSDTLEHVPDPMAALRECHRVLRAGGRMVFTAPIRAGRLTTSRDGLPPVYHGDTRPPYRSLVHTDFGDDLWTLVLRAGFDELAVVSVESPAGVAYLARKAR
jgi:SAM-dependent methyltransferase